MADAAAGATVPADDREREGPAISRPLAVGKAPAVSMRALSSHHFPAFPLGHRVGNSLHRCGLHVLDRTTSSAAKGARPLARPRV